MTDVVILGGGLAGLTLARELVLKRPGTSITVFEATEHPPPMATHKVGESCVEMAGHWLVNVLGLGDHLAEEHLPKLGLRFFWGEGPVEERVELGPIANKVQVPFTGLLLPSYQLDRGVLEGFMGKDLGRMGVDFVDGAKVKDVRLGDGEHTVVVERAGERVEVRARYVLDATGHASLMKKRLKTKRASPHRASAAWFRVPGRIKVDDWAVGAWQIPMKEAVRWRSTVHFVGEGYWVWLIPLATEVTSIGIVVGDETHEFAELASFERAMGWLEHNEPLVAAKIRAHMGEATEPLDFLVRRRYSVDVERVYSSKGWGYTGEAGAFIDPLYSPGSDFLAMVNSGHVDLAVRYLDGEDITERAERTERWFRVMYDMFLRVYEGMYPLFGNPQVMSAKILFDTAFYWAWPTLLYRNGALMDVEYVDTLGPLVPRMVAVQTAAQRFFKAWHERGVEPCSGAVDQFDVATAWRIYVSLIRQVDRKRLTQRLTNNLEIIEAMLEVLFRHAARDYPQVAAAERIDVTKISFDPTRWESDGLFGGPDRREEVARVQRECEALWITQ